MVKISMQFLRELFLGHLKSLYGENIYAFLERTISRVLDLSSRQEDQRARELFLGYVISQHGEKIGAIFEGPRVSRVHYLSTR